MATSIIRPVHAGIDVSFTITTSQWSGSAAPYTYTWTDSRVTEGCRVEVEYASTTLDTSALYIEYEKQSGGGGINFSAQAKPTANVCLTVHIINAQTGNVQAVTGADVSTSAISGAANVNEALTSLNSKITTLESEPEKLYQDAITTTETTYTLTSGKKFSEYRQIIVFSNDGSSGPYRASLVIPVVLFKGSTSRKYHIPYYYAGTLYTKIVSYYSDTQFKANVNQTGSINGLEIWGIK
jgi:hypothetical protein